MVQCDCYSTVVECLDQQDALYSELSTLRVWLINLVRAEPSNVLS